MEMVGDVEAATALTFGLVVGMEMADDIADYQCVGKKAKKV